MERILGIDTGTNSLGWAIIEKDGDTRRLLYKGTNIFSEGVKIEKGIESSKAADRTDHRSVRKHYWRRKVRKVRLLTILSENRLCPPLDKEELRQWKLKRIYPKSDEFMDWQRTEDKDDINPYRYRYLCLTEKLDLTDIRQRYILGRALYHLNQRRGFLSNRKETTKESDGKVITGIGDLTKEIEKSGCKYLGEYFYKLYQRGEKIRSSHYTSRKEHYLNEFRAICEKQDLDKELAKKLEKAIFYQRPLKSQKGTIGKCTFEKGKSRCPVSHPLYEEFRMYQFINNIKIKTPGDVELRELTFEEKEIIIPLFNKKSSFDFKVIAKALAGGRNNYCFYKDAEDKPYKFNFAMDTSVSPSPVCGGLSKIFGDNWKDALCEVYTLSEGKTQMQVINDVWHALFSFDDEDKLKEFAKVRLQLNEEQAEEFSKIPIANEYASLSLKAIRKILPYMKDYGMKYTHAVFFGNLKEVLPSHIWGIKETREAAIGNIIGAIQEMAETSDSQTIEKCLKDYLKERYMVSDEKLKKLYHPSMIELYPKVRPNSDGIYQLGSPRISSVKNPMAMHSLFRMRKVINLLLKKGYIDEETKVHIEFSRDLNDANMRKAIQQLNKENENDRKKCRDKIKELYKEQCGKEIEPTDRDILKYQLWEEQNHICLYTGDGIGICDFLGDEPKYDIEHTIPRSVGGDTTKENLTLCSSKFNRETKKTKLPSELHNHEEILQRIAKWKEEYETLEEKIRSRRKRHPAEKGQRDKNIQERHYLELKCKYWKRKYERFTMTEVPEGFSRRQGTDISVISRYARMYLQSVFKKVYIVKGIATSDFRKLWGLQDVYEKKSRVNHVHHCIDAITIACIDKGEYDKLAKYYHDEENHEWYGHDKPDFKKPWDTFVADIKNVENELLIAHYSKDNMSKQAKRNIRGRDGRILKNERGEKLQMRGDVAHTSLHNDTYYGAIMVDDTVKYVIRKNLDSLEEKDVKNIVDNEVRSKVENAILLHGSLKKAVEATIWMNEEKQIPIKKVRIFAGSVTRPLNIRQQRDLSRHEYKHQYHVMNDRNYMMAIYVGVNNKGKEKRDFELVSNLVAADYYKKSNDKTPTGGNLIPQNMNGLELRYQLKIGTMVLLYENSPEEVWDLDKSNLQKRLYKVSGLSSMVIQGKYDYGTIELTHHQDARPSTDVTKKNGEFKADEEFRAGIKMLHSQFKALVQGVDFDINDLGEITRLI